MIIYKCLNHECECEFKERHKDGLRCPKCRNPIIPFNVNPTEEELSKVPSYKYLKYGLVVKLDLKNTETFKKAVSIVSDFLKDDRIHEGLRAEYKDKFDLLQPSNYSNLLQRIGFIDVSLAIIRENPEGILEAFKDILITDVKFDIDGVLHYRGISKHFDLIEEGKMPPRYNIICIRKYSNGIEQLYYKYEKVKE